MAAKVAASVFGIPTVYFGTSGATPLANFHHLYCTSSCSPQTLRQRSKKSSRKAKKGIEAATKHLLSKFSDLQFFVGESMHDDSSLVFAYYKEGATDPIFLYFAHALKEITC